MNALQQEIEFVLRNVLSELLQVKIVQPDPKAWNINECAQYLGNSTGHLRHMVARNEIPHFWSGVSLRFHPAKIREWEGTGRDRLTDAEIRINKENANRKKRL